MRCIALLITLFVTTVALAQTPQRYARARIALDSPAGGMQHLAALGLAIDHASIEAGIAITAELSEEELAIARAHGFPVQVLIDDVSAFYRARSQEPAPAHRGGGEACNAPDTWPEPSNWLLGSMGGFFTLGELNDQLDAMRMAFPQLITAKESIGAGQEGRPIYMVRLSNNADVDHDRPELLYTALHHAREPVSASQLIYFLWHLLENYGSDAEATYVLDHFELYVVPCLNPDGYAFNEATNPDGGGMWRKNRRVNGNDVFGVDLNRNYAQGWALDNQGSSGNPNSDVYRGPSAFSEPETQAIRDLCESHAFRIALNYHAHGNLFIYPWGYGYGIYTPDSAQYVEGALTSTHDNRYRFGTADQTVNYVVNGSSDDWMYGEQQTKPKVLACTPECGGPSDWFWPPVWRIAEIGRENLRQNLRSAELCGVMGKTTDRSPAYLLTNNARARFTIMRIGLEPGPLTVSIEPVANIVSAGAPITYTDLIDLEARLDSIDLQLAPGLQTGDEVAYDIVVSNDAFAWREHVRKPIGNEEVVFSDDCSSLANWTTDAWDIDFDFASPNGAYLTDSPFGPYDAQTVNALTLASPIDLGNAVSARLRFLARWDLEGRFDGVHAMASSDGIVWEPLCGRYTRPGFVDQWPDLPVYDGQMPYWAEEEIDLDAYCGGPLWLRWRMSSNASRQYDGFMLDEVRVIAAQIIGAVDERPDASFMLLPNPTSETIELRWSAPQSPVRFELLDAAGRMVLTTRLNALAQPQRIDVSGIAPGSYQCVMHGAHGAIATQRLVIAR